MKGFRSGTLITTSNGLIPIEKLKIGDMVLTHTGKYRKIKEINKEKIEGCYRLQTQGSPNTYCGKDQRIICVEKSTTYNSETKTSERTFSKKKTKSIDNMTKEDFICIGKNVKKTSGLSAYDAWALGKFINKGSLDFSNKQITIYVHKQGKNIEKTIEKLNGKIIETKNYYKCTFMNEKIYDICVFFTKTKMLHTSVMELSDNLLKKILKSYCDECAKITEDKYFVVKGENKCLIYQLSQIISNIYSYGGFSLFWEDTKVPSFRLQFKDFIPKSANFVRIKNYLWQPVREICEWRAFRGYLYSLEVDIDNSYVANNIIVKC